MKKISISLVAFVFFVLVGGYVCKANLNLQVSAQGTYDMVQGEVDGHVIQTEQEIINLASLEGFYKNVKREVDDQVIVAIPQGNQKYNIYELVIEDGKLKLYYDIIEDGQGRIEYKVKLYDSIKKIYKNDQVTYLLVNDQEERVFLSYNMK